MTYPIARPAGTLLLALTLVTAGSPAVASTHHRAVHHGTATHHHAAATHHPAKSSRHHAAKPAPHRDAAPSGATRVPAGGIKLFCPARSNPLLVRKSTQGAGTTVTLVCH